MTTAQLLKGTYRVSSMVLNTEMRVTSLVVSERGLESERQMEIPMLEKILCYDVCVMW